MPPEGPGWWWGHMLLYLQIVYAAFFVYTRGHPINTKVMLTIDNIWRSTQRSLDDSICSICDAIKCSLSFLFLESRCRIIFVKPCPIASTASTLTRWTFLLLEHDRVVLKFVHFHWYTIAADWNSSVISDLWRPVARILHHGTFDSVFHDGGHTGHPQSGRCSDVWELIFQTCMVKSVAANGAAGLQDYIRFHCYGQDITFNAWHLKNGGCVVHLRLYWICGVWLVNDVECTNV